MDIPGEGRGVDFAGSGVAPWQAIKTSAIKISKLRDLSLGDRLSPVEMLAIHLNAITSSSAANLVIGFGSPINMAWFTCELRTLFRILHQLNLHTAWVGDPGLPAFITTEFLVADLPTLRPDFSDRLIQILHFEAQVAHYAGHLPNLILLNKDFDKGCAASPSIKSEQFTIFDEVKNLFPYPECCSKNVRWQPGRKIRC